MKLCHRMPCYFFILICTTYSYYLVYGLNSIFVYDDPHYSSKSNDKNLSSISLPAAVQPFQEQQVPIDIVKPTDSVLDSLNITTTTATTTINDRYYSTDANSLDDLKSEERGVILSTSFLVLLCTIIANFFGCHLAKTFQLHWIQLPLLAIFLGGLAGAFIRYMLPKGSMILDQVLVFNNDFFFLALLPPIIFYSGFSLEGDTADHFLKNFGAILWFSFFATLTSFLFIGIGMFIMGFLHLSSAFSLRESFVYGAIMSSTDPVTVLSLSEKLYIPPTILSIIAGESLMNDAFSIVLYRTLIDSNQKTELIECFFEFSRVFFGSIVVGVLVGLVSALMYKYMNLYYESNKLLECGLLLVFPWVSYLAADSLRLTGIVAILFSGLTMSHYTSENLSFSGKETSRSMFGSLSLLAETTVFTLLGLTLFSSGSQEDHSIEKRSLSSDWKLYISTLIVVSLSRAVSVYITSGIVNLCRRRNKLSINSQHIICVCGTRGAVAFALALRCYHDLNRKVGRSILNATLFYVVVTICIISVCLPTILIHLLHRHTTTTDDMNYYGTFSNEELYFTRHLFESQAPVALRRRPTTELSTTEMVAQKKTENPIMDLDVFNEANRDQHLLCSSLESHVRDAFLADEELLGGFCGTLKRFFIHFDIRYMKPIFTHDRREMTKIIIDER